MPRIAFAALLFVTSLVAGCSSTKPPAHLVTAQVAERVQAAGPCAKYTDLTTLARCHLYTGADAWRFVPLAGRSADLETQLRCAPFRRNAGPYERCISAPQVIARAPAAAPPDVEPSAAPRFEPPAQAAPPPASVARAVPVGHCGLREARRLMVPPRREASKPAVAA